MDAYIYVITVFLFSESVRKKQRMKLKAVSPSIGDSLHLYKNIELIDRMDHAHVSCIIE